MKFEDKRVLITGASEGIGLASARRFASKGARVVLVARDGTKLENAVNGMPEKNTRALALKCDISDPKQVEGMAGRVHDELGGVDILVNNAGFAVYEKVADQDAELIGSQMTTNYMGMVRCTKAFLPGMLERRHGRIVNVASVGASMGVPGLAPYCASKFAMLGFSESFRYELEGTGVDVTVVSPIMVRTNFFAHKSFGRMGEFNSISVDARTVAKAIEKAVYSRRLEITVPAAARCAIWAKQSVPYAVKPYIGRIFKRQFLRAKKD